MTALDDTAAPKALTRVGRNAAILAATTIFCKAGSIAVVPLILRAFTTAQYGMYSTAFAYVGLLGMLGFFGMNQIVIRDIARGDKPKGWVVFHCAALRMALLVPAAMALLLLGWAKGFSPQMRALTWLAFAALVFDAVTGAVKASMQAGGHFGRRSAVDAIRKGAQWALALVVILGFASPGIVALAAAVAVAAVLALVAAWTLGLSTEDFHGVAFAPSYATKMLKLAAPMGVSAGFVLALDNIDVWLLDWLRTSDSVAVYKAANVFKPLFLAQAVVWAFMPLAFSLAKGNRAALSRLSCVAARYLLILGAGFAIFFASAGGEIMTLLAGEKYAAGIPVFRIMGISLPFVFLSFLYLHLLTAVDKQLFAACIFAVGLAVNIAADIVFIKAWGPVGAMVGTLITEILIAVSSFLFVWKFVGRPCRPCDWRILAAIAGAIAAAILTQMLSIADMGIGALAVLAVLLVAFGAITRKDLPLLKKAFGR